LVKSTTLEHTMNKKLLTLAVAAALVAPAAAMADATLYGKMNVSLDYIDIKDGGFNGWTMDGTVNGKTFPPNSGRANRIGVKGSEDLGGGLKAIYQVELGFDATNENDNYIANGDRSKDSSPVYMRNTFVGLAGGWGTFLMGRHDTPLKISTAKLDLFADTLADYNGTIGFQDIRADNAVAYISPSFSGFTFAGAVIPSGSATVDGTGNLSADSIAGAFSLAAIYSNGPFYASVAYEQLGEQLLGGTFTTVDVNSTVTVDPATGLPPGVAGVGAAGTYGVDTVTTTTTTSFESADTLDKWRVGLGILDWNGFTLDGIYENWGGAIENDLWQIQAAYAFGNAQIKGMYGQNDPDVGFNTDAWAVGLDYNFSKRTKVYALYTQTSIDDNSNSDLGDWDGFSLGVMHSF
jgi:predicted porin